MKYYIPHQHGAWAMLIIPFLFGMFAAKPVPMHILLFVCWLLVYLFIFPLLQWIRTGRRDRYMMPVIVYSVLLIPGAIVMIFSYPSLLWFSLLCVPLFLVNCYYAKIKRERALINDMVAVLLFSLMVFIAYYIGGGEEWALAREMFYISLLYFAGTVFFIKTVIRERGNKSFYYLSIGYHILFTLVSAAFFSNWMAIAAMVLLVRSIWTPLTKMKIKHVGMLEILYAAIIAGVGILDMV